MSAVYAVAIDPCGDYILIGGQDKCIKCINHATGKVIAEYAGHGWEVLDVSVSSCGNHFMSGGADRTAVFWDVASGKVLRRLSGHVARINAVCCLPEKTDLLLTGSFDRTVRVWDRRGGREPIQVLDSATDSVESVSVRLPFIAVASSDGFVRIHDIRKSVMHSDAIGYADISNSVNSYDPVMGVRIGQDGAYYAASTIKGQIRLVDIEDGSILQSFQIDHDNPKSYRTTAMCFDKNEEVVVVGGADGVAYSFDTVSGEKNIICDLKSPILAMDYNKRRNLFAFGCLNGETVVKSLQ